MIMCKQSRKYQNNKVLHCTINDYLVEIARKIKRIIVNKMIRDVEHHRIIFDENTNAISCQS